MAPHGLRLSLAVGVAVFAAVLAFLRVLGQVCEPNAW